MEPDNLEDEDIARALEGKAREFEAWRYEVYADDVYGHFREFVPRNGKVFEMGAAWGKLLVPWRDRHGCQCPRCCGPAPRIEFWRCILTHVEFLNGCKQAFTLIDPRRGAPVNE